MNDVEADGNHRAPRGFLVSELQDRGGRWKSDYRRTGSPPLEEAVKTWETGWVRDALLVVPRS